MTWVSTSISSSFKSSEQKLDRLAALSTQCCQKALESNFLDPSWQKRRDILQRVISSTFKDGSWLSLDKLNNIIAGNASLPGVTSSSFNTLDAITASESWSKWNMEYKCRRYKSTVPSRGELPPICLFWARCNSANGFQQILVHQRLREAVLKFARNVADYISYLGLSQDDSPWLRDDQHWPTRSN